MLHRETGSCIIVEVVSEIAELGTATEGYANLGALLSADAGYPQGLLSATLASSVLLAWVVSLGPPLLWYSNETLG